MPNSTPRPKTTDRDMAIHLAGISKSFASILANRSVDLAVRAGDIHGIIGENGAGKSTLMSILHGFYSADAGAMRVYGTPYTPTSPADAMTAGIGMVYQHFMLVPNFTVLENIVLATDSTSANESKHKGNTLQARKAEVRAGSSALQAQYDLGLDLDAITETLPVGLQQRVEILKALYGKARILILDEPTAVLTPQETTRLFEILARLKSEGVTILLITHKLNEIMAITDRVSVMRHGRMLAHLDTKSTNSDQLARLMLGEEEIGQAASTMSVMGAGKISANKMTGTTSTPSKPKKPSGVCISVDGLGYNDGRGKPIIHPLNFQVRGGEIFGITGVAGNGQSELLDMLAALTRPSIGRIVYDCGDAHDAGEANGTAHDHDGLPSQITISHDQHCSVAQLKRLGVAHIPEDRQTSGLVLPFSAAESAILGYSNRFVDAWLPPSALHHHCSHLMQDFDIRPSDPQVLSRQLSGGNQQKLVLARELSAQPRFLLIGQPTRGVDIGAIAFIHKKLLALRAAGVAILLVSVELDEILALSDRIMVMHGGRNMGIIRRDQADITDIGLKMAGVSKPASKTRLAV